MQDTESLFNSLLEYIKTHCSTERADQLYRLLGSVKGRFLEAPASSKARFHQAHEGGLITHILHLIGLYSLTEARFNQAPYSISKEAWVTVAVLHDFHKIGDHKGNLHYLPNVLKSGKLSDAVPYTTNKEEWDIDELQEPWRSLLGYQFDRSGKPNNGETSLALIAYYAPDLAQSLTADEIYAIRYHDGAYGGLKYAQGGASGAERPLQILFHAADMLSARSRNWEGEFEAEVQKVDLTEDPVAAE